MIGSTKGTTGKDVLERLGSHQAEITITLQQKRKKSSVEIIEQIKRKSEIIGTYEEKKNNTDHYIRKNSEDFPKPNARICFIGREKFTTDPFENPYYKDQ